MTPWAAEKFKSVRPPFGALQTFDNTNDPVQRFCDPPCIPRIYHVSLGNQIHSDAQNGLHSLRVHESVARGCHGSRPSSGTQITPGWAIRSGSMKATRL